jgi:hypothetical protein
MSISDEITSAAESLALQSKLRKLSAQEAEQAISSAEKVFLSNPGSRWWWEAINNTLPISIATTTLACSEVLSAVCPDQEAWLFASDDEFPPWPVFIGHSKDIAKILDECPYFEYLVVSPSLEWAVIENHHNTFFAVGEPVATRLAEYVG